MTADPARNRLCFPRRMPEIVAEFWERMLEVDPRLEPVFQRILVLKAAGLEVPHHV